MNSATVAEILKNLWLNFPDRASWCEIDEAHIYCCVRPEAILHTTVKGMLFRVNERTYEACMVDYVSVNVGEDWLLVYAHPRKDDVEDMTEEEWHELYGDASGDRLDPGVDRGTCCNLRIPVQVAARER